MKLLQKNSKESPSETAAATKPPSAAMAAVATAQPPPAPHSRRTYDYEDDRDYRRPRRRSSTGRPPRCYLCEEEGHFVSNCTIRQEFHQYRRQALRDRQRNSPQGRLLELPAPGDDVDTNQAVQVN